MDANNPVIAEKASHKVAATFTAQHRAAAAAQALGRTPIASELQIRLLQPGQPGVDRALEPEQARIFQTILRAHGWLGLAGAIAGGLVFLVLWSMGVLMVTQSPFAAVGAMMGFGLVAGLLLGGLVSLRPDHDPYIAAVHRSLEEGHCVVLVHAPSSAAAAEAQALLDEEGGQTVRTL
jgi:hypothetical protein